MPRDGSGHAHNEVEEQSIQHGTPQGSEQPTSSGVDRSDKAAPAPAPEAGEGIGSTGQAQVVGTTGSGKGPIESTVDEQAQKLSK
ncbi:hypothetical protein Slin15195_G086530 [Septoria linicola]|uniref:Uncharacterized protein n=1 Tax=Septoria linicola TaxID=215465 RepID=A0A9Q9EMC6_9PEZI|nr:hypothetical protein Slin14017_G089120 [Septoria linicola]USW55334.1 hypothetical protein Slin15195_G086530 [Septoria linicola]